MTPIELLLIGGVVFGVGAILCAANFIHALRSEDGLTGLTPGFFQRNVIAGLGVGLGGLTMFISFIWWLFQTFGKN